MITSENILKNIEKVYQQKYGVAVFDIEIKNTKNGVKISGDVLTENQRDYIMSAFKKNKIKIKKESLKILSDASVRNEIGWAVVKNKITDLKLRFVSSEIISDKILKRIRCSQAFQGDILRVLFKKEDQLLVQQNDLTLGWVDRKGVILKKKSLYKKWASGNFALKDKVMFAKRFHSPNGTMEPADFLQNKIIEEAEKFLGVKYVLGGKAENGIDCSSLTQTAYKNSLNVILPRHSWDQKEVGKKVSLKNVKSGDLVFLIKKSNQHKHVGIVEKKLPQSLSETATGRNINLIHASLDRKKVVRQSLEEVFKGHDFVEARRIVE